MNTKKFANLPVMSRGGSTDDNRVGFGGDRERKKLHVTERMVLWIIVGLLCLTAGLAPGQSGQDRASNVLLKKHDTVNSIPRQYGRLAGVERSSDGTVLYFEAEDGTIRIVSVIYGIERGSLTFRTITVPRS